MPQFYAVEFPMFQRAMRNVTAITNSETPQVTTNIAHQYIDGMIVRLYIPNGFGMTQANQLEGVISIVDDTNFLIAIDTSNFDPFVIPSEQPGHFFTPAQVVPVGEINDILTAATQNVLPYP